MKTLPRSFLIILALMAGLAARADTGWETLFDGKTLAGWKASEHPEAVKVVDGVIACDGPRAHLFYLGADGKAEFENFELELEVKAMPGANSGVYFHATWQDSGWPGLSGIEAQVNNNQPMFQVDYVENKKTGSLYGFRNLYKAMARDGEWFTMNIQVRKPQVQIRINGRLMIDYIEPANVPVLSPGTTRDHLTKGTFALQCHDEKSQVYYRDIRVRRLPPGEDATVTKPLYDEADLQRLKLARDNFPLVNLRVPLGDKFSMEQVQALRNRTGIFAGITYHAGVDREVRDDASALAAIAAMKDVPAFIGLDVSGESTLLPETRAKFDFIVARSGPRFASDEQKIRAEANADNFVDGIVRIIETQPIDVYANVMVLPKGITASAETLWTEARMQRVIAAAAKHGVAFEINASQSTPSEAFIRLAKAAKVKFTVGADDVTAENYTNWSNILAVQQKVGLVWRDMWVPGHEPTRAQRMLLKK